MQEIKRGPGRPRKYPEAQTFDATPHWGDFALWVRDHGERVTQVRYPHSRMPTDVEPVIDTIWRGVPVLDGERVEYMTADGLWNDYGA